MIERSRHALDVVAIETGFRDVRDNLGLASIGTTSLCICIRKTSSVTSQRMRVTGFHAEVNGQRPTYPESSSGPGCFVYMRVPAWIRSLLACVYW